jgi:anhydro-N-acetylmuramic acid kinase
MKYHVIGLMSGTSTDGLDLAFCSFSLENGKWAYEILQAETMPYSDEWTHRLKNLPGSSAVEFARTDHEYGHLLGQCTREFILKHRINADFIASHGHTIFHQPSSGFTSQIGNGAAIKAETGLTVICDFRSGDVALGGQGAPLVPAGDRLLFSGFDYCLNLGGFANISFEHQGDRVAFDICPVNIVLNYLSGRLGKLYDDGGRMASSGTPDPDLLEKLDSLRYYSQRWPKSLGREWVEQEIMPVLELSSLTTNDLLSTFCHHISRQVSAVTKPGEGLRLLATGGGAHNEFLISLIRQKITPEVFLPDPLTIDFKEALIFAFLGVLRIRNESNSMSTVTGAKKSASHGAIY